MERVVKKIYKGCVDIKSFDRETCIRRNESLVIRHKEEKMTLNPRQVKVKIRAKSGLQLSKIGGEDYYLYSYRWIPDEQE